MTQIETAAYRRQQILDFLHLNPGAYMGAIGAMLFGDGETRSRHHNTVRTMIEWREIRYEGVPRCRQYWAIVKTTRPPETVKKIREANIGIANGARAKDINRHRMNILGRYVHTPGERPIPNQRGQGAVRRTVYATVMEY